MTDPRQDEPELDRRWLDAAREFKAPPPAPREAMWARIEAARRDALAQGRKNAPAWKRPAVWVPLAAAATLVLGIGVDRLWLRPAPTPTGGVANVPAPKKEDKFARYAAEQTFGQAEVLLTQYRADVSAGTPPATTPAEARRLLMATRLLLDSPTLNDPHLRDLLSDLELVLAQIAAGTPDKEDRAIVTEGLDRRGVLPRLRAAVPPRTGAQPNGAS